MIFYAHSNKDKDQSQWQLLKPHLEDTAAAAAGFGKTFGAESLAYVAGLLHDVGKYSEAFQKRLEGQPLRVDHSTPGAVEAVRRFGPLGRLLSYIISGHHCGLPDWGSVVDESSLEARLIKHLDDYSAFIREIDLPAPADIILPALVPNAGAGFCAQFLIRLVYSCLVDADFLNTEAVLDPEKVTFRCRQYSLNQLSQTLDLYLDDKTAKAQDTTVNRKRAEILASCRENAACEPGLFSLTVPTGGGKTLSSLSFALRHAVMYEKQRVIYVIPYTSIIEQNASVFKDVLGAENVLEHHSNFSYPQDTGEEAEAEYSGDAGAITRLAIENWDMPIIVTTNVQFFESLFASKSSKCRKLHNVAKSVVILDEAQMIPTSFLEPCLSTIAELVTNYKTTIVLCTATQPAIQKFLPKALNVNEIIDDPNGLYKVFKRTELYNLGDISDNELVARLRSSKQVLCVVNSKKHARLLYQSFKGEGAFHLSTRMCPAHRTEVLEEIKRRLKAGMVCRVVSTQLIESGVDVDFPEVYRSMAGIDSIAQASGRCNREGRLQCGSVYVFWPEKHGMPRGWLSRTASLGGMVIDACEDPLGLEGVKEYFRILYDVDAKELDSNGILTDIREQERQLKFPFRNIADKFKLIDDDTNTIIIPWNKICISILHRIENAPFPGSYGRVLQRFGVGVYRKEFNEMLQFGALELVGGRFYVLKEEVLARHYTEETGLEPFTESMFLNDTLII